MTFERKQASGLTPVNGKSPEHHRDHMGPLLMLSAALLFTCLNMLIKLIGPRFTIWDIAFYRFVGGILLIILIFRRQRNPFKGHRIRLLVIRGFLGSAAFLCLISAIRLLPISTVLVYFYTFPVFAAISARLLFKESLSRIGLACIPLVVVGTAVFFEFDPQGGVAGQILALTGSVFAGITVSLIKELKATNDSAVIYLYFCAMGALVSLPKFLAAPVVPITAREWVFCIGIVMTALSAQLLMNQGFAHCRGWEGGILMTSEVIFTALVGIVFLHDPVTWRFWVGGSLIVASVMVMNIAKMGGRRR